MIIHSLGTTTTTWMLLLGSCPLAAVSANSRKEKWNGGEGDDSSLGGSNSLRNFRSAAAAEDPAGGKNRASTNHRHRRLEDLGVVIDDELEPISSPMCSTDGVCDAILDPVTNLQFKTIGKSELDMSNPFCLTFSNPRDTEGFGKCPGHYDNIAVNGPNNDDPTNPLRGDAYLHLRDMSGGSLACGTGSEYTGDWSNVANAKCYSLCFDVNTFYDGCTSWTKNCDPNSAGGYFLNIYPAIYLQGGAPNHYRAAFRANQYMTDPDGDSPGWRRICAPLGPLDAEGNLPENEQGKWHMAIPNNILSGLPPTPGGSTSANSAWTELLADVVAIQLPVDFTGNPAERIGYDHICLEEGHCTDHCDPEPLCYWKHEWQCEHAKNEKWYSNFTQLMGHVDTFDMRHLCICEVLKDCCPDLCKIAEQEFLVLLLNVASGQVALDCGVKECDDCASTVKDVAMTVDSLLARSARTNYDCSKALQYLTGINEDEILCDSPGHCPQSDECRRMGGSCTSRDLCDPTQNGIKCEDNLCQGRDCTCMIRQTPPPATSPPTNKPTQSPAPPVDCLQTKMCAAKGGTCTKFCIPVYGQVVCDYTLCERRDCACMHKPYCQQTELCSQYNGTCVKKWECNTNENSCIDRYCLTSDDCTCQIPNDDKPCDTGDECKSYDTGGECTRHCVPIPGMVQCVDRLCPQDEGCSCKNCLQNDDQCLKRGGKCMLQKDCEAQDLNCDRTLCGGPDKTGCACYLPTPPPSCPLTYQCIVEANGACVKDCQEGNGIVCGRECQIDSTEPVDVECRCLKCRQSDPCKEKNGVCTPFCIARPGEVCDPKLCEGTDSNGNSICACKYRNIISTVNYTIDVTVGDLIQGREVP